MNPEPKGEKQYRSPIIPRVLINCLIENLSKDPEVLPAKSFLKLEIETKLSFRMVAMIVIKTLKQRKCILYSDRQTIKQSEKYKNQMKEYEMKMLKLAPQIEGRSRLINDEVRLIIYNY